MVSYFVASFFAVASLAMVASAGFPFRIPHFHFPFPIPFPWPFPHPHPIAFQPIAFACYGGGGDCDCPIDLTGDTGVLINVYPGYQCAYTGGACTWDDVTGDLQNIYQTNCPTSAPCSTTSGCSCPTDLNGDAGIMINQFTGYQCAYKDGACTWNYAGNLTNTQQTNCPTVAACQQPGSDS